MGDSLDLESILADVDALDSGAPPAADELALEAILAEASALQLDEAGNVGAPSCGAGVPVDVLTARFFSLSHV